MSKHNNKTSSLPEIARRIDDIAAGALQLFNHAGSFEREVALAQAVTDLREMLTEDLMRPIMALMNTSLGFLTDRDPSQTDRSSGKPVAPYPVNVVREVFIEAKLRGFHAVGNEFNIIAGRFYAAKAGFRRKLTDGKTFPGLANFRDGYDVPRLVGDKGAIVKCRATWTLNGQPQSAEFEFAVKVNSFMGADAIIGKAERKLCKRVHDLLAGVNTPDADIDDAAAPHQPAQAPTMLLPAPEPAGQQRRINYVTAVRNLLKMDGLGEADLLSAMRAEGMDETLSSLEEIELADPERLRFVFNNWQSIGHKIRSGGAK